MGSHIPTNHTFLTLNYWSSALSSRSGGAVNPPKTLYTLYIFNFKILEFCTFFQEWGAVNPPKTLYTLYIFDFKILEFCTFLQVLGANTLYHTLLTLKYCSSPLLRGVGSHTPTNQRILTLKYLSSELSSRGGDPYTLPKHYIHYTILTFRYWSFVLSCSTC